MPDYEALGKSVAALSGNSDSESGLLGYSVNGAFRVVDPDDAKRYFVRFANGNFVSALHRGKVPPSPGRPVLTGVDGLGRPIILGDDPTRIASFLDETDPGSPVGLHNHVRNSAMAYVTDTWLLKQLRVEVVSAYTVKARAGVYAYNGALVWLPESTLDLSASAPAVYTYRWVHVGIDPVNAVLVSSDGDIQTGSISDPALIDPSSLLALGYLPLAAVPLIGSDTQARNYSIEDLRFPVHSVLLGEVLTDLILTDDDGEVLTDDDGVVLLGDL